jgi:hypothetical protein
MKQPEKDENLPPKTRFDPDELLLTDTLSPDFSSSTGLAVSVEPWMAAPYNLNNTRSFLAIYTSEAFPAFDIIVTDI